MYACVQKHSALKLKFWYKTLRVTIIYSKLTDYIIFYSIIKNWTTTTDEIKILKTESPVLYGLYISIVSSNDHQQAKAALINVFAS